MLDFKLVSSGQSYGKKFLKKKKKKAPDFSEAFPKLAVRTGLEPATPCVTGMYSNQLNYRTVCYLVAQN